VKASRLQRLALAGLAVTFLATRLYNLSALPVFLDEAIHIDWAMKAVDTGRMLGVTDGGRYLPIWIYALVAAPAGDPLLAARLCSVLFGFAAALGLLVLGRTLYGPAEGLLAAFLYLIVPGTLLHDRMALVDSLLCALAVWTLVCGVRWAASASLPLATAIGALVGCATMTKLYGALLLAVPFACLALRPAADRATLWRQLRWLQAPALVFMLPVLLDLRSTLAFVRENLWPLRAGAHAEFSPFVNLERALLWPLDYLSPVGYALAALAALHALVSGTVADRLLLALAAGWSAFFVFAGGQDWFPRYLLPGLMPILLLGARQVLVIADTVGSHVGGRAPAPLAAAGLAGMVALSASRTDGFLLTNPARASLPSLDRWQYVQDWPSGYRLRDCVRLLEAEAQRRGPIVLLREFRSGPLLESLNLELLRGSRGIEVASAHLRRPPLLWLIDRLQAKARPVLLVLEEPVDHQLLLDLQGREALAPAAVLPKPGRGRQLELYAVQGGGSRPSPPPDAAGAPVAGDAGTHPLDGPAALEQARICAREDPYVSEPACRRALQRGLSFALAAEAHYHLGRTLLALERPLGAAAAFAESIRLLPGDLEQHLGHVEALELLHRHEEALASIAVIEAFAADVAAVHQRRGWNLALLGRHPDAEAALRRALELDASAPGPHNDLGVVLCAQGRHREAVPHFQRAIELDFEGLRARYNLGVAQAVLARRPADERRQRSAGSDADPGALTSS
jgi:tetratricopeptide (TPR) repeat protein